MKQQQIIKKINKLAEKFDSIKSVILIGSFGRNAPKVNSDIDYQILVSENFYNKLFLEEMKTQFAEEYKYSLFLERKNKWCFYFTNDYITVEIFICYKLSELDKYYLGSEIINPKNAIVFDKTDTIFDYLAQITAQKIKHFNKIQQEKVKHLIINFQNRFEACSSSHSRSDGYKFSVLFFHSLNALVRLIYLCEGESKYDYMPPNFLTNYNYKDKFLEITKNKIGSIDLRTANSQKRKVLDLYKKYLPIAITKFNLDIDKNKVLDFLEAIYWRDYFWNFRDISKFNKHIKSDFIYRSSALCLIKDEKILLEKLDKHNIRTVVDLRADREIAEFDYSDNLKSKFNIVNIPFDPWNQSVEFQNTYNTGTNVEIAYHFFVLDCKTSIKEMLKLILDSEKPIVIHCHAGKDRTGIIISILHLLTEADNKTIYDDYLASEMDTKKEYIDIFLDIVNQKGGIEVYLLDCGLTSNEIQQLKQKLQNGNN